ncbi:MAG: hypothetical protein EOS25_10295 [Mesorhizobium sp.]|uniref:hypothetical protein n=1 Tax=Mesorhizobium sp. TaxID=1871066 RepID=UPI000FE92E56|nr:hypothetical protein [Mesorhizobium sp.]RWE62976.1 MAG: hypothetical protein EOS24_05000 [Mesorhizobium sp.]RWF10570.1 MAG: hypothetical protein EOS69_14420 [Mesorhizobium sp.]RWF19659.1 MAG: hypothetical protein EOS25_10295 [Mesorhizobium sp.]
MSNEAILEVPVVVVSGPPGQSFLVVQDAAVLVADFGRDGDRAIIRTTGDEWLKTGDVWAATGENFVLAQAAVQVEAANAAASAAAADAATVEEAKNIVLASGGVPFESTALGLAATTNGQLFEVKGTAGSTVYKTLYKNVAGVATAQGIEVPSLTALLSILAKFSETPLYLENERVIGGFLDDTNRLPVAVLASGRVVIANLSVRNLSLEGEDGFYFGKRVLGGFVDTSERYPLAVLSDGSVYIPKLIFDTTELLTQVEASQIALLRNQGVLPSADVACYGDSLTQGGLASALAALLPGRAVANRGYGSQTAEQIAMRQGGKGFTATISGNQIVSGANTITHFNGVAITNSTAGNVTQLLSRRDSNGSLTIKAKISDVLGTITRTASGGPPSTSEAYTFTPDVGQTVPVHCPPLSPVTVQSQADAACTQVVWVGRNNKGINNWSTVGDVRLMVARLRAANYRVVILGVHNGTNYPDEWIGGIYYPQIVACNAELAAAFPDSFFDVRRYLVDHGLSDAGITPTAQDLIDIANDVVPGSLLSDGLHLTSTAYALVAQQVVSRFFTPNGW